MRKRTAVAKNKVSTKCCAYCGARKADGVALTKDHIVPRAFWKDIPYPKHFRTVLACIPCHEQWDREATYFRNLIVAQANPEDHPAILQLVDGPISRGLAASRSDMADMTRNIRPGFQRLHNGVLHSTVRIDLDAERFDRTPEKIIRGFFFMRNRKPLPSDYEVRVYPGNDFWNDKGFMCVFKSMEEWAGMGDDVFLMRSVRATDDPDFTAWVLVFYRSAALFAYTCPKSYGRTVATVSEEFAV
jgi:hypothetical protein